MTEVVTRTPPYGRNFACVLSDVHLRDMASGIVLSYGDVNFSFHSMWNVVLDENHDSQFPRVGWVQPLGAGLPEAKNTLDTYTIQLRFEKAHTTERTTDVRDEAHSDMGLAARKFFHRFVALYVKGATTFDGEDVDFRLAGSYTLEPFWDQPGISTTGVVLTFTIVNQLAPCVTDDDFPTT